MAVSVFRTGADEDKPLLYMMVQGTQKSDFVCFVCPFILSTDYLYRWWSAKSAYSAVEFIVIHCVEQVFMIWAEV